MYFLSMKSGCFLYFNDYVFDLMKGKGYLFIPIAEGVGGG